MLKAIRILSAFFAMIIISAGLCVGEAQAADLDGNGFDDSTEVVLARKFCPCFQLQGGSGVRPMPVAVISMSHSFRSVPATALWHRLYLVSGQYVGDWKADDRGWIWYSAPWGSPYFNYSWITGPVRVVANPPGPTVYGVYYSVVHLDWGGPSIDSPSEWYSLYRSSDGSSLGHPITGIIKRPSMPISSWVPGILEGVICPMCSTGFSIPSTIG